MALDEAIAEAVEQRLAGVSWRIEAAGICKQVQGGKVQFRIRRVGRD